MPSGRLNCILIVFTALLLSGCYEIVEEITYTDDVKGTFKYTANLSQSKSKLKTIMLMDTFMGANIPKKEEIQAEISEAKAILSSCEGISAVKVSEDYEEFIFKIECQFANTDNLNAALKILAEKMARAGEDDFLPPLSKTGQMFSRKTDIKEEVLDRADKKHPAINLMKGASYTCIYRFSKEIKSVSNKAARISKDNKAVFLKADVPSVIKTPTILNNEITFK